MSSDFIEPAGSMSHSNGYLLIIACLIFGYLCVHARAPSVTGQTDQHSKPFCAPSASSKTSDFDNRLRAFEAERLRSYTSRPENASSDDGGSGYQDGQEYDHDLSHMDLAAVRDSIHDGFGRRLNPHVEKRIRARERARAAQHGQIPSPLPAPVAVPPVEMHPIDSIRAELLAYRQTPPHVDVTSRQPRPQSRRESPPHQSVQGSSVVPSSKQQVQMFARDSMAKVCEKCNKAFVNLYSLSQHEAATHNPATRTAEMTPRGHDWQCDVCDYSTFKQTSFIQHMSGKHRRLNYQLDPTRLMQRPMRYSAPANGYDHPGPSPMPGSDRRHTPSWLMHNPTLYDDHITPDPDLTLPDVQKTWRCTKCDEVFYTVDERDAHEKDAVFHGDATARDEAFPALSTASSRSTSETYASAARAAASRSSSPLKKDVGEALVSAAEEADPTVSQVEPADQANLEQLAESGPSNASQPHSPVSGSAGSPAVQETVPTAGLVAGAGWDEDVSVADSSIPDPEDTAADRSFDNAGAIDTDHPLPSFALEPSSRVSPLAIGLLDDDINDDGEAGPDEAKEPIVIYDDFRWGEDIELPGPPGMEEFPKLPSKSGVLMQAMQAEGDSARDNAPKMDRSEAASAAAAAAEARLASLNRGSKLSDAPLMSATGDDHFASGSAPKAHSRWHTDEKPTFTLPDLSPRVSKSHLPADISATGILAQARQGVQSPTSPNASVSASTESQSQMPSWASDVGSQFAEEMPGEMIGLEPELSAANSVPIGGRSGVCRWAGITPSKAPEWPGADDLGSRGRHLTDEPQDDYGWGDKGRSGNGVGYGLESAVGPPPASQVEAVPRDDGWGQPLEEKSMSRSNDRAYAHAHDASFVNGHTDQPSDTVYNASGYRPSPFASRFRAQTQLPNFAPAVEDQPFEAFPNAAPAVIDTLGPRPAPVNALPSAWTAVNRASPSPVPARPSFASSDGDGAPHEGVKSRPVLMLDQDDEDESGEGKIEHGEDELVTIAVPASAALVDSGWAAAQWRRPRTPSSASLSGFSTSGSIPEYEHSRSSSDRSVSSGKPAKGRRQGRNQRDHSPNYSNSLHTENQNLNGDYRNDGAGFGSGHGGLDEYGRGAGAVSLNPRAKEWRTAVPADADARARGSNALMAHFPGFNQVDANGWTITSPTPSHATAGALAHLNGGASAHAHEQVHSDFGSASGWEDASASAGSGWKDNGDRYALNGNGLSGSAVGERKKGRGGKLQPRTTWSQQLEAGARAQEEQRRMAAEALSKRSNKMQARASVPGATTKVAAVVDDAEDEYGGW